jgi:hypothetical protein
MKRIASFTIIELVITMMITTIIISIGYYAYFLFNTQFKQYHSKSSAINEFNLLKTALQHDITIANRVNDTIDDNHFVIGYGDSLIYYTVAEKYTIRNIADERDTFFLDGIVSSIEYENPQLKLIKAISLRIKVNGTDILLPVNKQYTAKELMQAELLQNE